MQPSIRDNNRAAFTAARVVPASIGKPSTARSTEDTERPSSEIISPTGHREHLQPVQNVLRNCCTGGTARPGSKALTQPGPTREPTPANYVLQAGPGPGVINEIHWEDAGCKVLLRVAKSERYQM